MALRRNVPKFWKTLIRLNKNMLIREPLLAPRFCGNSWKRLIIPIQPTFMHSETIATHPITPGEAINDILDRYVTVVPEKSILAVTSKIISICERRLVAKDAVPHKFGLVKQEADAWLEEDNNLHGVHLTIKNNILIPTAGIDESNADGAYILYPENAQLSAVSIWRHLRHKHSLNHLGIIITDSHTTPMRKGVTGIALGWCGFEPLYSYVGQPDIFGRPLRITQVNIIDALAASAVFVMGEGAEQTPLALLKEAPRIRFLSRPPTPEEEQGIHIPLEEDIYAPLFRGANWIWNRKKP